MRNVITAPVERKPVLKFGSLQWEFDGGEWWAKSATCRKPRHWRIRTTVEGLDRGYFLVKFDVPGVVQDDHTFFDFAEAKAWCQAQEDRRLRRRTAMNYTPHGIGAKMASELVREDLALHYFPQNTSSLKCDPILDAYYSALELATSLKEQLLRRDAAASK